MTTNENRTKHVPTEQTANQQMLASIMLAREDIIGRVSEASFVKDVLPLLMSDDPEANEQGRRYYLAIARGNRHTPIQLTGLKGEDTWRLPPLVSSLPSVRNPDGPLKNTHNRLKIAEIRDKRGGTYGSDRGHVAAELYQLYAVEDNTEITDYLAVLVWEAFITSHGYRSLFTKEERDELEKEGALLPVKGIQYYGQTAEAAQMSASSPVAGINDEYEEDEWG